MIPGQSLSAAGAEAEFLFPLDEIPETPLIDRELGGVALSDSSQGLQVKPWTARYIDGDITIEAEDVPAVTWLTVTGLISSISLAFDQNMQPVVSWFLSKDDGAVPFLLSDGEPFFVTEGEFLVLGGSAGTPYSYMRWFDTAANDYVTTEYVGASSPRVTLDDKRAMSIASNDVILTYIRNKNLYFRAQRDRFTIEYLLIQNISGTIRRFGMNTVLRLQWEIMPTPRDYTIVTPAEPDFLVSADPVFKVPADPVFVLPVQKRDPCGEC